MMYAGNTGFNRSRTSSIFLESALRDKSRHSLTVPSASCRMRLAKDDERRQREDGNLGLFAKSKHCDRSEHRASSG